MQAKDEFSNIAADNSPTPVAAMHNTTKAHRALFWLFVVQIIAWTLSSVLTRHNLPFDTVEGIAWGNQWAWGYDKHPPIAAWLSALAAALGGYRHWPVYLVSQLSVCTGYYLVWRLAKHMLSERSALIATALLGSIWYYTLATPKFNPNTLMIPVWAGFSLAFYHAYRNQQLKHWLGAGILAGLCMLTKYESAIILICAFALLLITANGRQAFKQRGVYCAIAAMLLVWAPNLYWNMHNNWIEIQYALGRAGDFSNVSHGWTSHFYWPWKFLLQQLGTLSLCLILIAILWRAPKSNKSASNINKAFVLVMGLGPLLLTLAISAISGMYLYSKWASAYFNLLPLMTLVLMRVDCDQRWTRLYYAIALFCIVASAIIRGLYLSYAPSLLNQASSDAYFPGREIAAKSQQLWQQHSQAPWRIIAGDHYLVANISVYAPNHPKPYFDFSNQQSNWLNDQVIKHNGALFAWRRGEPFSIATLQQRFPRLEDLGTVAFNKQTRNPSSKRQVVVYFAYLPATP